MNCPNCNSEIKPNAVFCGNCGKRIDIFNTEVKIIKELTIGRAANNDICINSTGVSSNHAKIFLDSGSVWIEDLKSTNGTYLNEKRINKSIMKSDDHILLGQNYLFDTGLYPAIQDLFIKTNRNDLHNKTIIENQSYMVQQAPQFSSSIEYSQSSVQPYKVRSPLVSQSQQININVQTKPKSVGVAILLTLLFGPLGMLYSTVLGAVIMFFTTIILAIATAGFSVFITAPICIIWAAVAADNENKKQLTILSNQSNFRTY